MSLAELSHFFEKEEANFEELRGDDSCPENEPEDAINKAKKPTGEQSMQGIGPAARVVEHATIGLPDFTSLFADVASIKAKVDRLVDMNKSLEGIILQQYEI